MHNSAARTPTMLLEASGLSVSYGRHQALVNASIQVAAGEVVVILVRMVRGRRPCSLRSAEWYSRCLIFR